MQNSYLTILCTCPDQESADKLAATLVEEHMAACVNIIPGITSVYRWKDRLEKDQELLLVIKTSTRAYKALEKRIQELHPYELPEIIAVPIIEGAPAYLEWLGRMTSTPHED
jgi:periplasmic divalent cation tolerance protein